EFPISFFLDFAWNPDKFDASQLEDYTRLWAEQQFGSSHAGSIAKLITAYTRFNGRRKPELLSPDTYSIFNYNEAERISGEYNELAHQADSLYSIIPYVYKDAYF